MAQWGNTDDAANSVSYAVNQFKVTANTDNQTAFYGNTSAWAADNKLVAGQFGVSAAETKVGTGGVATAVITKVGSGYTANATVTFTATNGGTSAAANVNVAVGRANVINITNAGSGYKTDPTITISAPTAIVFNGNTAVADGAIALSNANTKFLVGDKVTYAGNTLSTPVGLTDNTLYYVSFANTTVIKLAATPGGANIAITDAAGDNTTAGGATLTGETAEGYVVVGGGRNVGATAGWNIRTVGTGGRAGRVQYECLVAMGSIGSDGSDDTILPDA